MIGGIHGLYNELYCVKHLEKFLSVFGGHLICLDNPPRKEVYYVSSFKRGRDLMLTQMGRKDLMLTRRSKDPSYIKDYIGVESLNPLP
jgi:hypothetical protein